MSTTGNMARILAADLRSGCTPRMQYCANVRGTSAVIPLRIEGYAAVTPLRIEGYVYHVPLHFKGYVYHVPLWIEGYFGSLRGLNTPPFQGVF